MKTSLGVVCSHNYYHQTIIWHSIVKLVSKLNNKVPGAYEKNSSFLGLLKLSTHQRSSRYDHSSRNISHNYYITMYVICFTIRRLKKQSGWLDYVVLNQLNYCISELHVDYVIDKIKIKLIKIIMLTTENNIYKEM